MAFDPLTFEPKIQQFWEEKKIRELLKDRNKKGKKFYFLQGPPYTSGRLHLGQAWNNSLKDAVLRFKRANGFDVWDRGGYDMHGLPTENKVLAKHNLKLLSDISQFGEEKFAKECEAFCVEMMQKMNVDLKRLGVSMDHDNAYQPIQTEYIEGIWHLVKQADKKKRLYKGKRTMGWSAHFATALAKHEMEYIEVKDTSVFVKFKIAGTKNEFLIIWTTTPWTLPLNLAIMVNPELEYVKVKVEDEFWIVAKALAGVFINATANKQFEVIETFTGEKLKGTKYEHFWQNEIPALQELTGKYDALHTVLLSKEFVDTSAGTGLVHCAPGCGPEDYEIGHKHGLPAFNEVDEQGFFPDSMGFSKGWQARKDDKKFIEKLDADGVLIAKTQVTHDYPHDERSKNPIIFRTTEQWFFKVEDLKKDMLDNNKQTYWVPQKAKNAFTSWLENLRDNSITKQRFWGTPAPIWVNENDPADYIVVGSVAELKKLGAKVPTNLHKPYIDKVTFEKDGKTYRRIPDVLDVWIDAGSASWNCLDYLKDPALFKKYFPADFILEGKDQIRGWFNLLAVASTLLFDKSAFENVFMHGFIAGVDGQKMSKTLGNIISPYEIIDKYGADTLRLYTAKVRAGEDMSFSWEEVKQDYRTLSMLYNVVNYYSDLLHTNDTEPQNDIEEAYILSKVHSTIKQATHLYDTYQLHLAPLEFERLLQTVSRDYIQFVREKATQGTPAQKKAVLNTLHTCITALLQIAHPTVPFVTEELYQKLREQKDAFCTEVSISMKQWPQPDESLINVELESQFESAGSVIQAILSARDKSQLGVRWPVREVIISSQKKEIQTAVKQLQPLIQSQTNVKSVALSEFSDVQYTIKPNYKNLGKVFGQQTTDVAEALLQIDDPKELVLTILQNKTYQLNSYDIHKDMVEITQTVPEHIAHADFSQGSVYLDKTLTPELEQEGMSRELIRRIQSLRKDMGLKKSQKVQAQFELSEKLVIVAQQYEQAIRDVCGIETIEFTSVSYKDKVNGEIRGESFVIGLQ